MQLKDTGVFFQHNFSKHYNNLGTIGIQTCYDPFYNYIKYMNKQLYKEIDFEYNCKNCGKYHVVKINIHRPIPQFCCPACAIAYNNTERRKLTEKRIKETVKNHDVANFYKKYNGYVMSEICKCEPEYREELIEWWNFNCIKFAYFCRNAKAPFAYLKKSVEHIYWQLKKKKQKEIFFADMSVNEQIKYFDEALYERS